MRQHQVTRSNRGQNQELTLKRFVPRATPFNVSFFGLWMLGLFVMFMSPAPVALTDAGVHIYSEKLAEARTIDTMDAAFEVEAASQRVYRSKVWPWQWNEANTRRYEAESRELERAKQRLDFLEVQKADILREGKQAVGLWSAIGLGEMREHFWSNFNWGLGLAKGMTIQQAWYAGFRMLFFGSGSRDENILGILLTWLFKIMYNVSVGLIVSVFSFMMAVPGIIDGYGESFMSSLAFFAIALISSASVVMSVLTCMWGTAAGGAVLAIKSAQRARLQDGRSRGRRYIKRD